MKEGPGGGIRSIPTLDRARGHFSVAAAQTLEHLPDYERGPGSEAGLKCSFLPEADPGLLNPTELRLLS